MFDLDVVGVMGCGQNCGDPSYFRKLVDICRKGKVRIIAVEPQYPR